MKQEERMSLSRRRLAATATVIGGAALGFVAFANNAVAESGDDAAVATTVEAFRKAMLTNDRAQLEALCAPQLSYGHSAGKIETKEEFVTAATSGKSRWKSLAFANVKNSIAGNNAISRFMLTGETESDEKVTPVNIGVLMVWQKQENAWKLLARQAFKV
jgi:hypothetical protein